MTQKWRQSTFLSLIYLAMLAFCCWHLRAWKPRHVLFVIEQFGLIALYFYGSTSFAYYILSLFRLPPLYSFPIGYLILGSIYILGGLTGVFSQYFLLATPLILLLPELFSRGTFIKSLWRWIRTAPQAPVTAHIFFALFFYGLSLALFSTIGIGPLYPQNACDQSLIHSTAPKLYLQNGEWANLWWLRLPFIPHLNHMVFTGAFAWMHNFASRADLAPSAISPFLLFGILPGVYFLFKESRWMWLFAGIGLSMSLVRWNLSTSHLDLPAALYIVYIIIAAFQLAREPEVKNACLLGILCGAGFTAKLFTAYYTLPIVAVAAFVFFTTHKQANIFTALKSFSKLTMLTVLCATPVIVLVFFRNLELTGHLLFPFVGYTDPNPYLFDKASLDEQYNAISHWKGKGSLSDLIQALDVIIRGGHHRFSDSPGLEIGPLFLVGFLCFLFLASFNKSKPKTDRLIFLGYAITIALCTVTWFHSSPVLRYLLPVVFISVLGVVYLFQFLSRLKSTWTTPVISLLVLIPFSYNYENFIELSRFSSLPIPITQTEIDTYLTSRILGHNTYKWFQSSPKDSLIYTYGDACHWGEYPRPFLGDWFGYGKISDLAGKDTAKSTKFLKDNRIDYVVDNVNTTLPRVSKLIENGLKCLTPVPEGSFQNLAVYQFDRTQPDCVHAETSITDIIRQKGPKGTSYDFSHIPSLF